MIDAKLFQNWTKQTTKLGFALAFMLFSLAISAQVKGVITDAGTGEPLIGASVLVKGTTVGTITGLDGDFSLDAKVGDVLTISYTGFTAVERTVGADLTLNVALEQGLALDEIVVTGYTTQKKSDFTGAVATLKAAELKAVPSGNIEQQLQGRASGVTVITNGQPGTASIIRVRGFGAFGGNQPLYIVYGVPVGSTDFLSPDDIESSTVLKDAASASIYGARAANGVIVYTTKKGAKNSKRVNITYDGTFGFTDPNVGGAPKMLSPQEQADWTHIAYRNNAAANGTEVKYTHPQFGTSAQATLPDYLHANGQNGVRGTVDEAAIRAAAAAAPGQIFLIKPNREGTNWYDEITRSAGLMRHSLGFQGGSENSTYYVGLSMQDQQGILINNRFKRYSARANVGFDLTKKLRVGTNFQFTYRSVLGQQGGNGGLNVASDESEVLSAYRMPSIIPVFDELGQYASTKAAGFNNPRNPVRRLTLNNGDDRNFNGNMFGNLFAELDVIKGLTLRTSLGGGYTNSFFKDYNYIYLGDSEPEASYTFNEGGNYAFNYVFTNTASYQTTIASKHNISALVGAEFLNTGAGRSFGGSGINPFSTDLNYVNLSTVSNPQVNSNLFSGINFESYFGKLDYNLNNKYYLSGTIRRDGSSTFGPNSRYGVFPAVAASWRVSSENFMKGLDFISDLKLRAGWGQMGNTNNVNPANQFSLYAASRANSFYPIAGQNSGADEGYYRSRIGNPDAKWETSTTLNFGIDASLFNGKLEINGDLWRKVTDDLLYTVPLPAVLGNLASAPAVNIASMLNNGLDIQFVNHGKIKTWNYDLTLNNSFLHNEITYLAPNIQFFGGPGFRGINPIRNQVGNSLSAFYGYKMIGYFKDKADVSSSPSQTGAGVGRFKYEDVNKDGKITPDDRQILGNPIPKYTGGIVFNVSKKNLSFETYLYTSIGNKLWNQSKWFTDFFGSFEGSGKGERAKQSWTPELGDNALAPIWESASNISTNGAENSWYMEDGSYLRMQYISIGYSLPSSMIKKAGLSKAKLNLAATNIFTITKYSGLDPGVGGSADTNFGIDVGNYPVTRGFNLGISLGF